MSKWKLSSKQAKRARKRRIIRLRKRRKAGLLVAAVLILLAIPGTASATTHWFYERTLIPEGETVEVASSSSKLMVVLKLPKTTAIKVPCTATGIEAFWNTPEGGRDETRSIAFSCEAAPCGELTLTPILFWSSSLEEAEPPEIDLWNASWELTCGATSAVFSGTLEAKMGDVDPEGEKKEEGPDELDNTLTFKGGTGVKAKSLEAPNGDKAWLSGFYRLGGKGTGIGDE